MTSYGKRVRFLAVSLSALAGYIDALGFLSLKGYFVSFMSGNSTQMSVSLAQEAVSAAVPAALIGLFVAGVILGSILNQFTSAWRRTAVLLLVTALLCAAALSSAFDDQKWTIAAMALAMGAENAIFERDGEVHIGLTYMTGTLVKLGQRITSAILGGDPFAWCWYFLLWVGLATGAFLGALSYPRCGLGGLWFAAGAAALITAATAALDYGLCLKANENLSPQE